MRTAVTLKGRTNMILTCFMSLTKRYLVRRRVSLLSAASLPWTPLPSDRLPRKTTAWACRTSTPRRRRRGVVWLAILTVGDCRGQEGPVKYPLTPGLVQPVTGRATATDNRLLWELTMMRGFWRTTFRTFLFFFKLYI